MTRFGYILLDHSDPDITRQALQLDGIGDYTKIFVDRPEKTAGIEKTDHKRLQRQKLIDNLKNGDIVFAASLDRWCDNLRDFLETGRAIELAGADLCVLAENLDTRSPAGRQTVKLIRRFEQLEFSYQSGRKKAGIEAARKKGRRIGRPQAAVPPGFRKLCRDWAEGRISGVEAARQSGLGSTSFYKKASELGFKPAKRRQGADQGEKLAP